jgi:GntR family transcriptional regulator of arabinose operon
MNNAEILPATSKAKPKRARGASNVVRKFILDSCSKDQWILPESELADRLGVTRYAVTKALNELCSQGIVRREPGRGTQVIGAAPSSKPAGSNIAFIASELTSVLALGLVSALQRELADLNFRLALRATEHKGSLEIARIHELRDGGFRGAIVTPDNLKQTGAEIASLYESGFPLVVADRPIAGVHVPYVATDHFQGAVAVVSHLISLGHTRIAHVTYAGDWHESHAVWLRHEGYLHALREAGIEADPSLIGYVDVLEGEVSPDTEKLGLSAYIATHRLLAAKEPPTAIFAVNDYLCDGIVKAAMNHGLAVPADLSIAGFDHDAYVSPEGLVLTTYAHPLAEISRALVNSLQQQMSGSATPSLATVIPGRLILGNSTRRIG